MLCYGLNFRGLRKWGQEVTKNEKLKRPQDQGLALGEENFVTTKLPPLLLGMTMTKNISGTKQNYGEQIAQPINSK